MRSGILPCSGFTLVELLVVIGIFVTSFTLLLGNFIGNRPNDELRTSALRLAADIQAMQTYALTGDLRGTEAVAFGVHVDAATPTRYTTFADRLQCVTVGTVQTCAANYQYDAGAERFEGLPGGTIDLPREVTMTIVTPTTMVLDLTFAYPRGTIRIIPDTPEVRIELRHPRAAGSRAVVVNRISGRVDVE